MGKKKGGNWFTNLPWPIRFIISIPFLPAIWGWKAAAHTSIKSGYTGGETCKKKTVLTRDENGDLVRETVYEKNKGCVRFVWSIPLTILFYYLAYQAVLYVIELRNGASEPAPTEERQEQVSTKEASASENDSIEEISPDQDAAESNQSQPMKPLKGNGVDIRIPTGKESRNSIRIGG